MSVNLFGSMIREARKNTKHTLLSMAIALKTTPGLLSAIETGRSKEKAIVSNGSVLISDLPLQHKLLIAGFANSKLNAEQMLKFKSLLESVYADRQTKDDDDR